MGRSQERRRSRSPRDFKERRRSPRHYSRRAKNHNRDSYDKNRHHSYKGLRAWDPREFPEFKQKPQAERQSSEDWVSNELKELEEKGYSVTEIPSKPITKKNSQWQHDKFDVTGKDSDTVSDKQTFRTRASPTYS